MREQGTRGTSLLIMDVGWKGDNQNDADAKVIGHGVGGFGGSGQEMVKNEKPYQG